MSETEEKPVLRLNRVIAASRERAFAAWTTPDAIKGWFGPASCRVLDVQIDLRVGGEYCFRLSTEQLGEIKVSGQYQEVTPPAKLVYTWQWAGNPEPVGVSTEIRLTHEQLPSIESRDDHARGWSGTFDKLEKYLVS